ncbi:MAG: ornithine carbamoyltransferase [Phycisphaeraceae bacterium]|nr:ornithine carbamoyltransferase [Phycisphaeraceae bacterium]
MRNFIAISDVPAGEIRRILQKGFDLREQRRRGQRAAAALADRTFALIFEKPSLRTRVSFEQAIYELGGQCIPLSDAEVGLGKRETPWDVGRVLGGMVHGIVARVFEHRKLIDLSESSGLPVVNALSDYSHPCQALADAMTMMDEFGQDLKGRKVAYIGDSNNVARSLTAICGKLGVKVAMASPKGYEFPAGFVESLRQRIPGEPGDPGLVYEATDDPREAVRGADVIYTDTWVSMGQEEEQARRMKAFSGFQVNAQLVQLAGPHAIVMHCLPAHRGQEITAEVMDGPQSRVFPQAHNRLHAQKGLLAVIAQEMGIGG